MALVERQKPVLFLLIVILASVFIACPVVYSDTIWEKRRKAVENSAQSPDSASWKKSASASKQKTLAVIDPSEITIPEECGIIQEAYKGHSNNLFIHIQDPHMNYEGQKSLAHILESLMKDYRLRLILLEGKVTDRDFTYIRDSAPLEERIEKSDKLLKEGVINGVNYVNIASDYPMVIQGIEDKSLYDADRQALWDIDGFKDAAGVYIDSLIAAGEALKQRVYNKAMLDLEKMKQDYKDKKIDTLAYYEYLHKKAGEKGISLGAFPNLDKLVRASRIEKNIDLKKLKSGKASQKDIERYKEYMALTEGMDSGILFFKEEPLLEAAIMGTFIQRQDQNELVDMMKAMSIMRDLLDLKVVPEEYSYFRDNKKDFDAMSWQSFLRKKSDALNLDIDIPDGYSLVNNNLSSIEEFYRIAGEREDVFLRRSRERMAKDNINTAVIITGGFHTPTLTKLMRDNGYSYVVITPKVTTETDDKLYRGALKREWLPDIK